MQYEIAGESFKTILIKTLFFAGLIISASGYVSPPIALTVGIIFGLSVSHPLPADSRDLSRFLLQASVVALGFGMNLHEVIKAGKSGFVYTALGISFALIVGLSLGKFLQVRGNASYLITTGTAICGGSAIAAIAPIIQADEQETAVSLATIFILNSVALIAFPLIGAAQHLSQTQFGLWAALAIHDTSSVVGASSKYGSASFDRWNDGEIGARALDRSARARNRRGEAQQVQSEVAVVHFAVLSRRGHQHVRRQRFVFLDDIFHARPLRPHRNIVFDRLEHLSRIAEESRMAPARARHRALDHRRRHQPLLHSHRLDFAVSERKADSPLQFVLTGF